MVLPRYPIAIGAGSLGSQTGKKQKKQKLSQPSLSRQSPSPTIRCRTHRRHLYTRHTIISSVSYTRQTIDRVPHAVQCNRAARRANVRAGIRIATSQAFTRQLNRMCTTMLNEETGTFSQRLCRQQYWYEEHEAPAVAIAPK